VRIFLPFSGNGAHLIIYLAPNERMTEKEFLDAAAENAAVL
jgi:hypothetical protein